MELNEVLVNNQIVLYGLGIETERILNEWNGKYNVIGLLDGFKTFGQQYGYPILDVKDVVKFDNLAIIVVARPGSCKAIAKRIGDLCRENQIALMDIRGKDLLVTNQVSYDLSHISGVTKAELMEKIEQADVVSFDLFDTLVMRQTLSSDDVLEYVNCKLQEKGIFIEDFCRRRLASEKELSKDTAPTLTEIYEHVLTKLDDNFVSCNITARELADLEWNIDFDLLISRKDVCDFFRMSVDSGKPVYVVSDTYYCKPQLKAVLEKCGITEYTDILASCDYKTSKTQKLYGILTDREKGKKCLHIGDDIVSDIENASKWGIKTCHIFSGLDLLETVGSLGFADYEDALCDRLKIGMFISNIFNSPFQFETEDKHIKVTDAYDIGYLFCAPIISDFAFWFRKQIDEQDFENIWFGARDGYLIKKLYTCLLEDNHQTEAAAYFLTSRIAAIKAGVKDESDIQYVDEMKFSGTLEECLRERFGIEAKSVKKKELCNEDSGLLRYKKAILDNALNERENYQRYINGLGVKKGNIAFFDFVAKGTSQMYIQRLVDSHIKGLYFLQLEAEHMKDKGLDIQPFYSKEETDSSAIFDNYYILETVLTSPDPSVNGFDENGAPIYAMETRSKKDIKCFQRVQEGILEYFDTYLRLCPKAERKENKKLDEAFLKLIHGITITDKDFLSLVVEDPFFNRMTNITDVL